MSDHAPSVRTGTSVGNGHTHYWSSCPCGWEGPFRRTRDRAEADASTHHSAPRRLRINDPGELAKAAEIFRRAMARLDENETNEVSDQDRTCALCGMTSWDFEFEPFRKFDAHGLFRCADEAACEGRQDRLADEVTKSLREP